MRVVHAIILVAVTACTAEPEPPAPAAQAGPPPGPPPYQMRAALPDGDRTAGDKDGALLFSNRCGACHLPGAMGTNLLTVQRLALGDPPQNGLLENRADLTPAYVKTIVRTGKLAMPPLSRVEVTDAELDAIAAYLGQAAE